MTETGGIPVSARVGANSAPSTVSSSREKTPWLAAILCLLVPVLPTIAVLPGPLRGNGAPARLIGFVCFGLVVLGFLASRRRGGVRSVNPGAIILVGFFLLQSLTYAVGTLQPTDNIVIESGRTRTLLSLIIMVGVALFIIQTVHTPRQRSIILGSLAVGLTYACFVGMLQNFEVADLRNLLVPPGFVQVISDADIVGRGGALRAVGTSEHAIEFSVLAAATVLLTLHFARYALKPLHCQLAGLACLLSFLAIPSGVSRSGLVTFVVSFAVYMFAMNVRLLGNIFVFGFAVVLAQKIAYPSSINALWSTIIGSDQDASITDRTGDYAAVSEQFHLHPIFGLGLGGYPPTEYRYLDNQWLQAIVQGGVVGVGAMILLVFGGFAGMTWALRNATTRRDRDMTYAVGSAFAGVVASSFTFDLFAFQQAAFLLFIFYGLLWTMRPTASSDAAFDVSSPERECLGTGVR